METGLRVPCPWEAGRGGGPARRLAEQAGARGQRGCCVEPPLGGWAEGPGGRVAQSWVRRWEGGAPRACCTRGPGLLPAHRMNRQGLNYMRVINGSIYKRPKYFFASEGPEVVS